MRRRDFLTVSAASIATAAVAKSGKAIAAGASPASRKFSRARFKSWLNDEFLMTARGSMRAHPATLIAVDDARAAPGLEQFTIVFRGSASLPTGSCWLSRPDGTQFMLHVQGAPGGALRRANFSLLEPSHV